MGNEHLLPKSCTGASHLCDQPWNNELQFEQKIILKKSKVRSTEQIKQKIMKYIETNRLHLYPLREKKVLETLVSVDQQHIGDKIIQMDKRLKLLENQKRQIAKMKTKQQSKSNLNENDSKNVPQTGQIAKQTNSIVQKQKQVTQRLIKLKQQRRKLFQDAQCLLLQDLDMVFEQIPKFDPNYQYLNSIMSLSQSQMGKTNQYLSPSLPEPKNDNQRINNMIIINSSTINQFHQQKKPLSNHNETEHKQTTLSKTINGHLSARKDQRAEEQIRKLIKVEDKKVLKKNPTLNSLGSNVLTGNGLLLIVPIECFGGIGALRNNKNTGLPSGASLLQILLNKIRAVNIRRDCDLGVSFLVNEEYLEEFNQNIQKVQGVENYISFEKLQVTSNLSNHESEANYSPLVHYNVISFKNIWPSFDAEQKIILNSVNDEINFSSHDGDLFAFIENSIELKLLIQKYRYVNITNVNNMLSQIADASVIGFLEENEEIDIAVKVLKPKKPQVHYNDFLNLDDQRFFTIKEVSNEKTSDQKSISKGYKENEGFLDIQEYYLKSRIFLTDSGPLKRLLMSRITRKISSQSQTSLVSFYLRRSINEIFYSKFTAFIMVEQEYEFSHVKSLITDFKPHVIKNGQIGYSRYCKRLLGLSQCEQKQEEDEMVEIDAGILHRGSGQIIKIVNSLKKIKELGFPIILYSEMFNNTKDKQQQKQSPSQ